ncbi:MULTISPECIES: helix-turn-helix domain-containing protein [Serratia]|uniref:helix-turn-helix domain-containing protein n=1 Tax=Serratia TaxID=613 RepID=UPI0009B3015E|nr:MULTISPECIES: helix-turn-helix domain-containing protein [Serratia]MEB7893392.1 helix-turn-helix domain-containing protein [Serratia ureilytica]
MTNDNSVASRIIERRAMIGWSQNELAKQSGVAAAQISRYEAGVNKPSKPVVARLANAMQVPFEWLAFGDTQDFKNERNERGELPVSIDVSDEAYAYIEKEAKRLGVDPAEVAQSLLKIGLEVYELQKKLK